MCNWFVCLAVWAMTAAKDIMGKVAVSYFIIMSFVLSGFEHVVANMYYIPIGILVKSNSFVVQKAGLQGALSSLSWLGMITKNFIPVLLGNIVGGAFLVGVLYWALYLRKNEKTNFKERQIEVKSAAR